MVQAQGPEVESVLSGSQDVSRCHHLKLVGRVIPGRDVEHSAQTREAISKMAYEGSHDIFGKRVAHFLCVHGSGLDGRAFACHTHRAPRSPYRCRKVIIIKPEVSESDEAIKSSHYAALVGLELTL